MSILYSSADFLSQSSWLMVFKVLMLSHYINNVWGSKLGLDSISDFLNSGAWAPTECASCLPMGRSVQFGSMVIFCWLFFVINKHHSSRWISIVSWLNCLILFIDLWSFSAQHLVKCAVNPNLDSSTSPMI